MKTVTDCFGRVVRITDERLAHAVAHAEMAGMEPEIERTLRHPELVRRSISDTSAPLL